MRTSEIGKKYFNFNQTQPQAPKVNSEEPDWQKNQKAAAQQSQQSYEAKLAQQQAEQKAASEQRKAQAIAKQQAKHQEELDESNTIPS